MAQDQSPPRSPERAGLKSWASTAVGRAVTTPLLADIAAVLLSLATFAIYVRLGRYAPPLVYDESTTVVGLQILDGKLGVPIDPGGASWTRYYRIECYPPVYYVVTAMFFWLFGFSLTVARAVTAFFIAATSLLAYAAARRPAGPVAGFVAMAVYLTWPHFGPFAPVAHPSVAAPFFLLAAAMAFLDAAKGDRPARWIWAGTLYGLAVLSHFVAIMAALPLAVLVAAMIGRGFWRRRTFYLPLVGFLLVLAAYAAVMYPYYEATLKSFLIYRDVRNEGPDLWQRWPLVQFVAHGRILFTNHPAIGAAFVASLAGLLALAAHRAWRGPDARASARDLVFYAGLFVGTVVLLSFYPNVNHWEHYGSTYMVFLAVAAGIAVGHVARRLPVGPAWVGVSFGLAALAVNAIRSDADSRIRSADTPVAAGLDWIGSFPGFADSPVFAPPEFVFSRAGGNLLSELVLRSDASQRVFIDELLRATVPDLPAVETFGSVIANDHTEAAMIGVLKPERLAVHNYGPGAEARLLAQGFAAIGTFLDPLHPGTSFTLWRRPSARGSSLDGGSQDGSSQDSSSQDGGAWGRYAIASRSGPLELRIAAQCALDVSGHPAFEPVADGVSALRFALPGGPHAGTARPLLVRVAVAPDGDPAPAGFVIASPIAAQIDAYFDALLTGRAVPRQSGVTFGILGGLLPNGERGRDLLVDPAALQADRLHVAVFATRPVTLTRMTLALPTANEGDCNEAARTRLQQLAAATTAPYVAPITVRRWAHEVGPDEPLDVLLSRPAHRVRTVVRLGGTIVARSQFENTDRLVVTLPRPGQYGIEVWISQDGTDAETVTVIYPRVRR